MTDPIWTWTHDIGSQSVHNQSLASQEKTDINIGLNKTRHDTSNLSWTGAAASHSNTRHRRLSLKTGNLFYKTCKIYVLFTQRSFDISSQNLHICNFAVIHYQLLCLTHWSRDKLPAFEMHFVERNRHVVRKAVRQRIDDKPLSEAKRSN